MFQNIRRYFGFFVLSLALLLSFSFVSTSTPRVTGNAGAQRFIVQGQNVQRVAQQVRQVGGIITHELSLIQAVGARLNPAQAAALQAEAGMRLFADRPVIIPAGRMPGQPSHPTTDYPTLVGADALHAAGITGQGVTVAVIDTGYWSQKHLNKNAQGQNRVLAQYNAIQNVLNPPYMVNTTDANGHGTHVTGIILNSGQSNTGSYQGIAPNANLITIQAFGPNGSATYGDVIRGLEWVVTHKDAYNIRVLNLSFSAPPQSYYWDDPLNQAVMRVWQAGIVVVAAAGNAGPGPFTIGAPGNVPYVITVGAMSDNYTPGNGNDDVLASFSAAGPTVEGFVKPDLVAGCGPSFCAERMRREYNSIKHVVGGQARCQRHLTQSGTG